MRAVNQTLADEDRGSQTVASLRAGPSQEADTTEEDVSSRRGHTRVCVLCGLSVLRRRSDLIFKENPSNLEITIMNMIESRIVPRQVNKCLLLHKGSFF